MSFFIIYTSTFLFTVITEALTVYFLSDILLLKRKEDIVDILYCIIAVNLITHPAAFYSYQRFSEIESALSWFVFIEVAVIFCETILLAWGMRYLLRRAISIVMCMQLPSILLALYLH